MLTRRLARWSGLCSQFPWKQLSSVRYLSGMEVPLTAEYYSVKRGAYGEVGGKRNGLSILNYQAASVLSLGPQVSELDIEEFRSILGGNGLITDPEEVAPYNVDWLRNVRCIHMYT